MTIAETNGHARTDTEHGQLTEATPPEFHVSPLKAEELREFLAPSLADDDPLPLANSRGDRHSRRPRRLQPCAGGTRRGRPGRGLAPGSARWTYRPSRSTRSHRSLALYAENVAEHTQTPVDVAAVVMLGVLSTAALGLRVDVWWGTEELSLYVLLTAISGDRKSSVMDSRRGAARDDHRRTARRRAAGGSSELSSEIQEPR